jgi:hypothetical protein
MLFLLLLVPLAIGVGVMYFSKGKVTLRELLVQEAAVALVVVVGYFIALGNKSSDVEHWNGVVASKDQYTVGCCHPYCCGWCQSCSSDSNGNQTCSTYCCSTCYEHNHDLEWDATSSNDENVFHDGCNPPYSSPPQRWSQIVVGEPTSVEHEFTNYIKGNPDSILRRRGLEQKWGKLLPDYPRVYDHYRADKFIGGGAEANKLLAEMNGRLGKKKQVDVIVVATKVGEREFADALREHWLGGKKNDLVVVIGVPNAPTIGWVEVVTWSKSDSMNVAIRDQLQSLPAFDVPAILSVIETNVSASFVRRRWQDFDYLKSTVEPSTTATIILFVVGIALSIGLSILMYKNAIFASNQFTNRRFR